MLRLALLQSVRVAHPQISLAVRCLELHVARHPRADEYRVPVLGPSRQSKRSVTILLREFLAVNVLSRRFASGDKKEVISREAGRKDKCERAVHDHSKSNSFCRVACLKGPSKSLRVEVPGDVVSCAACQVEYREYNEHYSQYAGFNDECEEVAVVAATNAIVEPRTVVIVGLHTSIALTAVM